MSDGSFRVSIKRPPEQEPLGDNHQHHASVTRRTSRDVCKQNEPIHGNKDAHQSYSKFDNGLSCIRHRDLHSKEMLRPDPNVLQWQVQSRTRRASIARMLSFAPNNLNHLNDRNVWAILYRSDRQKS